MGYRKLHADNGLGTVSGVVTSFPVGYTLGELREEAGNKLYKLFHNAGNSQINPGYFAAPIKGGAGPYSLTLSTTTNTRQHIGAVLVEHATVTTGGYGWGLVKGYTTAGVVPEAVIATGTAAYIGNNGVAIAMPESLVTGNLAVGLNLGAVGTATTGARSGDFYINLM